LDEEHEKLKQLKSLTKQGTNPSKADATTENKTAENNEMERALKKARIQETKEIAKSMESSLALKAKPTPKLDLKPLMIDTKQSNIQKKKNLLLELQEKKAVVAEIKNSDPAKASDLAWEIMAQKAQGDNSYKADIDADIKKLKTKIKKSKARKIKSTTDWQRRTKEKEKSIKSAQETRNSNIKHRKMDKINKKIASKAGIKKKKHKKPNAKHGKGGKSGKIKK